MNTIPALDLQKQFFQAIGKGDLRGMTQAYEKGADPKIASYYQNQNVSAWLYAALQAPLSAMSEIFSLLETWNVKRRGGSFDFSGSHPCIELTLRTRALNRFEQEEPDGLRQTINEGYMLAWKMWEALDQQERRRVLLMLDVWAWACENGGHTERFTCRVKDIWRDPPSLKGFYSEEFCFLRKRLRTKKEEVSFSTFQKHGAPTSFSEETLFWCLQSLCIQNGSGGIGSTFNRGHPLRWGFHFLTAPEPILKGFLKHEVARRLIIEKIEEHVAFHLHPSRASNPAVFYYEDTYAQLVCRFHTLGAPWPEAWPDSARTHLLKFPSILRFAEQEQLTRTLNQDATSVPSTPSPSLRGRI